MNRHRDRYRERRRALWRRNLVAFFFGLGMTLAAVMLIETTVQQYARPMLTTIERGLQ